jgi:cholesterol transport system auxiliary component
MTRIRLHWLSSFVLFAFTLTLSGCLQGDTADRKHYIVEAKREGGPPAVHSDTTLRVRRFNVDEAYASKQLVYRIEEFRYESDYYHEFLVLPGLMITEKTRDWLADSGLFGRVSSVGSRLESTYMLEGNVTKLCADFTDKSAPMAVMEIRFFLLVGADVNETVVLSETYRAASPIPNRSAEAVVEAFSKSLTDILARLEADVKKVLARKAADKAGNH